MCEECSIGDPAWNIGHLVGRPSAHLNWLLMHQPQDMLGTGLPAPCWLLYNACILFLSLCLNPDSSFNTLLKSHLWIMDDCSWKWLLPPPTPRRSYCGPWGWPTADHPHRCGFPGSCACLMQLCIPGTLLIRLVTTKCCHDSYLMTLTGS